MKKHFLLLVLTLLVFQAHAANYYWVGGGGNWSDLNHWRLGSSAGPIPSIVPATGDNVFFDANSGFGTTTPTKTVTLNANGFCNNMTWSNVPNSPLFVTSSPTFTVQLSGNLSLSPTTTYQAIFAFKGSAPATITTNGTVLGQFGIEIDKPGSSLTVTDSLIVPSAVTTAGTNGLTFTAGTFDITGKKVKVYLFSSSNNNVRALQMANADLTVSSGGNSLYQYTGANKTLNAAGSTLLAFGYRADGGTYNKVIATSGTGPNSYIINNTTFSSFTFLPAVAGSNDIGNGNTIDTLIFNGTGSIGSNNTIGRLSFGLAGSISGTGNAIRSITCLNNFNVTGNYTNTVDSLVLAPYRIAQFRGTFNINKYLYVAGMSCEAFTEINGDSTGTVNFAAGAVANISNVVLTEVEATGPITPIAVNGVNGGGNTGFTITEPAGTGTTLYWVGGSGDWNNRSHWSTSSGGAGGACVPFRTDNVVFDANSGLATGTVTTSSGSFCRDMTWTGVGTITFNESATSLLRIYGSVVLDNSVTMNAALEFTGDSTATITTNGSTLGALQLGIRKTGSGMVTLADNWNNTTANSGIQHYSGGLNMANRTVATYGFSSNIASSRSIDITNATLSFTNLWEYRESGKSLVSAGSHITAPLINTDGMSYPWVDITGAATPSIGSTTFGRLTFTNTSATSAVAIGANNIIRRLEFNGRGVINGGGNSIDTLILAASRNYNFAGTNTINKYLQAQSTPCTGLSEVRGPATFAFASGAVVNLSNVYMANMTATGPITPIAFNGADAGGNSGWTINVTPGSPRYWINGAGDWNDASHWSTASGGAGGACVPTVYDNVYFDAGSGFTPASKIVTINNGNAYARNISWTGAASNPIFNKSPNWNLELWGDSAIFNPLTTLNMTYLTFKGSNATFLKGSPGGNFDFLVDKAGGSLTMLENYNNPATAIGLISGSFNAPGRTLQVDVIDNLGYSNATNINISNANITASTGWTYTGPVAAHALNAAGSIITTPTFAAEGFTYNKVNITGTAAIHGIMNNTTMDSLVFTNTSTSSVVGINGASNTLNYVEYKGSGNIYGTGNTIDTLVFFPGKIYTLTAGTNTTITSEWFASGTPCNLTEIVSSSSSANATITKLNGAPEFDYIRVRRITAAGSTPFVAFDHTIDQGGNTSWNIAPYNGAAPIYGLGPDTALPVTVFPYTLYTDGFFGAPSSQYTWTNASTADSLVITGDGTYGVTVNFPDGCSISDQITITSYVPLPVTLVDFTAKATGCQSLVQWKVTDAAGFSHFVVERSTDGQRFSTIGEVKYLEDKHQYAYTDGTLEKGTTFYRLRLVDLSGKQEYSSVVSVRSDCDDRSIRVYPTVTSSMVQVALPAGYEQARLCIVTAAGQRIIPPMSASGTHRTVSLEELPAGVYLLQVTHEEETSNFRIIRQ